MDAEILQKLLDKFGKDPHIRARKIGSQTNRIEINPDVHHKELFQFMRREGFKEFYKDGIYKFWNDEGVVLLMSVMANTATLKEGASPKVGDIVERINLVLGEEVGAGNVVVGTTGYGSSTNLTLLNKKRKKKKLKEPSGTASIYDIFRPD